MATAASRPTLAAPDLPAGLPSLDPAANPRCWHMAREAKAFSRELAALRAALAEHAASAAALLGVGPSAVGSAVHAPSKGAAPLDKPSSVAAMLAAPLPRVWDSVEGRLAEPLRATATHYGPAALAGGGGGGGGAAAAAPPAGPAVATMASASEPSWQESRLSHTVGGGGSVHPFAALEAAAAELLSKVDGSVLAPLDAWQRDLALATARLPELESLRAELGAALARADEARARAESATASAEAAGSGAGAGGGGAGVEAMTPSRREAAGAEEAERLPHGGVGEGRPREVSPAADQARGGIYRVRLVPRATGGAGPPVLGPATALGLGDRGAGRPRYGRRRRGGPLGALVYACTHPGARYEGGGGAEAASSTSPYDRQYGGGLLGRRRRTRLTHLGRGGPTTTTSTATSPPTATTTAEPGAAGRSHAARAVAREEDLAVDAALAQRAAEAARASLVEMEAAAARQLSALCRDAAWDKSYAQAELVAAKGALQAGAVGLGPVLLPLPGALERHPSAPPRGAFADLAAVAFAPPLLMPSRPVGAAAVWAPARERAEGAARELAAGPHVATAAPMLRGARPDVGGMERAPVPPAAAAAAGPSPAAGGGLAPTTPARGGLMVADGGGGGGIGGGGGGGLAAAEAPTAAASPEQQAGPASSLPAVAQHTYDPARRAFVQQQH